MASHQHSAFSDWTDRIDSKIRSGQQRNVSLTNWKLSCGVVIYLDDQDLFVVNTSDPEGNDRDGLIDFWYLS